MLSKGSQQSSLAPKVESINSSSLNLLYGPILTSIHDYWKNHSFDYTDLFVGKLMSLLFNMLLRFVIAFLPRSNCLFILWLKSLSALTLEPKETKSITFSSSLFHEVLLRSFNVPEPGGPQLTIRK